MDLNRRLRLRRASVVVGEGRLHPQQGTPYGLTGRVAELHHPDLVIANIGKPAAIRTYIHPWKKPVLVAGDTPASDGPMFLHTPDIEQGALRLFVSRKANYHDAIHTLQRDHAASQLAHGMPVTADRNWLVVTPDDSA